MKLIDVTQPKDREWIDRFIAVRIRVYVVGTFTEIFAVQVPVPAICGNKIPIQIATNSIRNFSMVDKKYSYPDCYAVLERNAEICARVVSPMDSERCTR